MSFYDTATSLQHALNANLSTILPPAIRQNVFNITDALCSPGSRGCHATTIALTACLSRIKVAFGNDIVAPASTVVIRDVGAFMFNLCGSYLEGLLNVLHFKSIIPQLYHTVSAMVIRSGLHQSLTVGAFMFNVYGSYIKGPLNVLHSNSTTPQLYHAVSAMVIGSGLHQSLTVGAFMLDVYASYIKGPLDILHSNSTIPRLYHAVSDVAIRSDFHQALTVGHLVYLLAALWILRTVCLIYNTSSRSRKFRQFATSRGCGPATALPRRFLGNLRHKVQLLTYPGGDLLDELYAVKYRTFGSTHALHDQLGLPIVVHTIDPLNLHAIFSTSWDDWKPPRSRGNTLKPLAQEGLLLAHGEQWHRKRKLVQRYMGIQRAKDTGRDEEHIQMLFNAIGPTQGNGWTGVVDLLELLHRAALDLSTEFLLGISAGAQAAGIRDTTGQSLSTKHSITPPALDSSMTYNEAYETVRTYLSWRSKLGSIYWLADSFEYRRACATLNAHCDEIVAQAIARSTSAAAKDINSSVRPCLIDSLVRGLDGDPVEIRNIVMDLFIAGQNMTGTTAAWLFAQLERHPEIYKQVREEVLAKFGTEHEPKEPLIWSNMKACTTMQNVILETLRMYPLLANIGRNAKCDTVLPQGGGPDGLQPIAVPKGATVTCNVYLTHRREEEWGSDAWEFRPDRWIGRKFGPEYAPFGGGARICVGQQLSMTEISFVMTRIMQRFSQIEAPEGQDNLVKGYRALLAPKNGVKVRLRRAA